MTDDDDFMSPNLEASLDDLKDIYRILTEHSDGHPELIENGFYATLTAMLEAQAQVEGVDLDSDAEWAAWLCDTGRDEAQETSQEVLN